MNQILARVNTGPGFVHEVVYGEDGAKTVAKVGVVADELGTTLKGIRRRQRSRAQRDLRRRLVAGDDVEPQPGIG